MDQFVRCRCPACTKKLKVPNDFADDLVVACTRCRHPYTVAQLKLAAALQTASQVKSSHGQEELPKIDASNIADFNNKQLAPPPFSSATVGLLENEPGLDLPVAEIEPSTRQGLSATAFELTGDLVAIVNSSAQFTWRLTGYLVGEVLPFGMAKLSHLSKPALAVAAAKPRTLAKRICFVSCLAGLLFVVARSQFPGEPEATPRLNPLSDLEEELAKQGINDLPWKEKQPSNSKDKIVKQPQSQVNRAVVAKSQKTSEPNVATKTPDKNQGKKQASSQKQQGPPSLSSLFSNSKNRVVEFYNKHHVPQRIPTRSIPSTYRSQQRRWRAAEREAQYEVDRTMQQFNEQTATQTPWLYWDQ